ncbi:MAG: class I SAM-dependent methyltransferase [Gaiellaceae bacterium]
MSSVPPAVSEAVLRCGYGVPGFAAQYDANRPRPPAVLLDLLPRIAAVERPEMVVDLGSGTGLSTRFWADRAASVVGVEPIAEMRDYAERATSAANVRYVAGASSATGLPDACADIVTCAQSLQWMEPDSTFAEVGRILRPGGVFGAYEYFNLATGSWEADAAFFEARRNVGRLREELGLDAGRTLWPVSEQRLEASGCFRYTAETSVHGVEEGSGARLVGFLLSEGSVTTLLERVPEEAFGLDRLREIAAQTLGDEPTPWHIGYHLWFGVK